MMSALPLASARLRKLWIPFLNNLLDGASCISTFSFFLVYKRDFNRSADFTHISASNTASDDVTNYVTHRTFNTDLLYSCRLLIFWSKSMKNLAVMAGLNMILWWLVIVAYFFGPPCIHNTHRPSISINYQSIKLISIASICRMRIGGVCA